VLDYLVLVHAPCPSLLGLLSEPLVQHEQTDLISPDDQLQAFDLCLVVTHLLLVGLVLGSELCLSLLRDTEQLLLKID
jgi:hypothetical protein